MALRICHLQFKTMPKNCQCPYSGFAALTVDFLHENVDIWLGVYMTLGKRTSSSFLAISCPYPPLCSVFKLPTGVVSDPVPSKFPS